MQLDDKEWLAQCERLIGGAKVAVTSNGRMNPSSLAALASRLESVYKDCRKLAENGVLDDKIDVEALVRKSIDESPATKAAAAAIDREVIFGADTEGGSCD